MALEYRQSAGAADFPLDRRLGADAVEMEAEAVQAVHQFPERRVLGGGGSDDLVESTLAICGCGCSEVVGRAIVDAGAAEPSRTPRPLR